VYRTTSWRASPYCPKTRSEATAATCTGYSQGARKSPSTRLRLASLAQARSGSLRAERDARSKPNHALLPLVATTQDFRPEMAEGATSYGSTRCPLQSPRVPWTPPQSWRNGGKRRERCPAAGSLDRHSVAEGPGQHPALGRDSVSEVSASERRATGWRPCLPPRLRPFTGRAIPSARTSTESSSSTSSDISPSMTSATSRDGVRCVPPCGLRSSASSIAVASKEASHASAASAAASSTCSRSPVRAVTSALVQGQARRTLRQQARHRGARAHP
jgi:hypothetical protein